ncbi:MAG: hypothetical protein ABEJ76_05125 [Halanaeroarchaeum sp.]
MRDATLDAFGQEDEEPARSRAGVEPTAEFDPGGLECEACGAVVERRWRQGDAMVCGECKDWSEG